MPVRWKHYVEIRTNNNTESMIRLTKDKTSCDLVQHTERMLLYPLQAQCSAAALLYLLCVLSHKHDVRVVSSCAVRATKSLTAKPEIKGWAIGNLIEMLPDVVLEIWKVSMQLYIYKGPLDFGIEVRLYTHTYTVPTTRGVWGRCMLGQRPFTCMDTYHSTSPWTLSHWPLCLDMCVCVHFK